MNVNTRYVEDTPLTRSGESRRRAVVQRGRLFAGAMFGLAACMMVSLSGMSCGSVNFGTQSGGPSDAGEPDGKPTVGPTLLQQFSDAQCLAPPGSSAASVCSGLPARVSLPSPTPGDLLIVSLTDIAGMSQMPTAANMMFTRYVGSAEQAGAEIWYGTIPDGVSGNLEVTLNPSPLMQNHSMDIEYIRLLVMEWHGLVTASDVRDGSGSNSRRIDDPTTGDPASARIVTTNAHDLIVFTVSADSASFGPLQDQGQEQMWRSVPTTAMAASDPAQQVWYRIASGVIDDVPTVIAHGTGWDAVIAAFKIAP